jgi:hypothetical protein
MLKKSKISNIEIHSDEWHKGRLAKFTSSGAYNLMGTGYDRYVRLKVGEAITGLSRASGLSGTGEINTEHTMWGSEYEEEAVRKLGIKLGVDFLIVQKLISEEGSRFGSTPDGLKVNRVSPDDTEYEVEPIEVKCPPTFDNYLLLWECETPSDLKVARKEYYWQVLDQMDICDSLIGHFAAYHPDFKSGNMRHIVFNLMRPEEKKGQKTFPLFNDMKALRSQKAKAVQDFELLVNKLIASGFV